jgi:hypothetical protein
MNGAILGLEGSTHGHRRTLGDGIVEEPADAREFLIVDDLGDVLPAQAAVLAIDVFCKW